MKEIMKIDLKTWKSRMKPWEIIKQLIGHKETSFLTKYTTKSVSFISNIMCVDNKHDFETDTLNNVLLVKTKFHNFLLTP